MLAYKPRVDYENADTGHLTAPVTAENVLGSKYHGVDTEFIDAIANGKAAALN